MKTQLSKQKVLKTAWTMLKNNHVSNLSEALKKAWVIIKIQSGKGQTIEFAKETGELRTAKAVLTGNLDTIKQGFVRIVEMVDGKAQWRSFRISNLLVA